MFGLLIQIILQIRVEGGRATGVELRDGSVISAKRAVVTNASVWDTEKMLPPGTLSAKVSLHQLRLKPVFDLFFGITMLDVL